MQSGMERPIRDDSLTVRISSAPSSFRTLRKNGTVRYRVYRHKRNRQLSSDGSMPKCEPRHEVYDQVHIRLAPGSRFLRQLSVFIALDGSRFRQPYVKIKLCF